MNCKYKLLSNERFCQVLNGECQFLKCGYGPDCPVYNAYPDWDGYVLSAQAKRDGTARAEAIASADLFDSTAPAGEIDVINIDF